MDLDDEELEATRIMNGAIKKRSKNPKCKYCGEEFVQNKKGRKRDYYLYSLETQLHIDYKSPFHLYR